jgi:dGTPase
MAALREFMFDEVYMGEAARREHGKIERVLSGLFDLFCARPELVAASAPGADLGERVVDYLAGMTDRFAIRAFEDLCVPRAFIP